MAYFQRNIPSPNRIATFGLRDFSGGLNNRSEVLRINEASDVLNMAFSNDTLMEKRKGTMLFDDVNLTQKVVFIDEYKPYKEADQIIRATETSVYAGTTLIKTVQSRINGVNYIGKYLFVDGNKIYAYGKFPQLNKTYEKVIGTTNPSYVVFELVATPTGYTPLTTEHVRGVMQYDYNTMTMWYEPCQNEIDDTYSGANVLPAKPKYVTIHKGRLFISGSTDDDDNVFISDVQNPYYFPVYLPIQLPPNSDKVKGLIVYDDAVLVGRAHDMYVITGVTNAPPTGGELFQLRKINTHTGVANQDCMVVAHSFFLFVGSDGEFYALSSFRDNQRVLSTQVLSNQLDIRKAPINLTVQDLAEATSFYHDDMWYVALKGVVIVYSYRHRAWTFYKGINPTIYSTIGDALVWGDNSGRTLKQSENYLDLGVPYIGLWKSRWFDMDEPIVPKHFRDFFVVAHVFEQVESDIVFSTEIDYRDTLDNANIRNEISKWGVSKFGSTFISRTIAKSPTFTIGQRGRTIRFSFRNGYVEGESVATRSALEAHPKKIENMIVKIVDEDKYVLYQDSTWRDIDLGYVDQSVKVYEINGEYELRNKR